MAIQHSKRLALRLVGVACLAAGLFPYYSHTSGPASGGGTPPMEVSVLGSLPDRSSSR